MVDKTYCISNVLGPLRLTMKMVRFGHFALLTPLQNVYFLNEIYASLAMLVKNITLYNTI